MHPYGGVTPPGHSQSIIDRLGRRSFWVFVLLAMLAIAAYALFESQTAGDRAGAAEINLSGRRRMFSQHIGLLASQLLHRANPEQTRQLADAIEEMASIHQQLLRDAGGGQGSRVQGNKGIGHLLAPELINAQMQHFFSLGRQLARLPADSPEYRSTAEALVSASQQVLPELDRLVGLYQAQSEERSDTLRFLQACALAAALGLLGFSGLGVLRPLIREVRHALDEQQKSETALLHAIAENRLILETTDEGMFGVDRDGYIGFANPAGARILGRDVASLIGRHHHPDIMADSAGCPICRALASTGAQISEGWFNRLGAPGEAPTVFPVEYSVATRPDGEGAIISFRDITDRHQAEFKLQRFQQRLVDAIEALDDAFALFDADDRLILYNLRFTELFPQQSNTIRIGMSFRDFISDIAAQGLYPQTADSRRDWLEERLETHRQAAGSTEIPMANGCWLRVTERHTGEGGTVVIWSDVSNLKQALIAADQGSRAKSEFVARMSHELRTPLNAILGFAKVLDVGSSCPQGSAQREYVQHILRGGQHLLGLINEILDLSSIEAGRLAVDIKEIELGQVLRECIALTEPLAHNRDISLVIGGKVQATVAADRLRLKQVLLNLLSNGIKYNRNGGEVRVVISEIPDRIRLEISDSGMGIAPELAQRVFQPFERLGIKDSEGTGIGLAITRQLVELMGGSIGFESTPGVGTTFRVELLSAGAQGDSAEADVASEPTRITPPKPIFQETPCLLAIGLGAEEARLLRLVVSTLRDVRLLEADNPASASQIPDKSSCRAVIVDDACLSSLLAGAPPTEAPSPVIALSASPLQPGLASEEAERVSYWQAKPIRSREMARLLREIVQ